MSTDYSKQIKEWEEEIKKLKKAFPRDLTRLERQFQHNVARLEDKIWRASMRAAAKYVGVKPGDTLRYVSRASWVDPALPLRSLLTVRKVSYAFNGDKSRVWVNFWAPSKLSRNGRAGGFYVSPEQLRSAFVKEKPARCEPTAPEAGS